ncbi:hypothetical protein scyTo_0025790, partial [Scyliorhinus torazame]|nr:hypothetical protein [Scyliorhinus torazame]
VQESFAKNNMACLTEDILHPHAGPKGGEEFYGDPTREKTERNEDLCWKFRAQIQQLIEKTISNQYEQDMSVIVKGKYILTAWIDIFSKKCLRFDRFASVLPLA